MVTLRRNSIVVFALSFTLQAHSQTTRTVRHHSEQVQETSAASALLDQAEALLARHDYARAQPLLQEATTKDPKSYQAWYDLGYAEEALHHSAEAITAYRKSVEINPKIFESNLNLGLALGEAGQEKDAVQYLQAATKLQPAAHAEGAKERAWIALARVQMAGDPALAQNALTEAERLAPQDPEPHLLLGGLYENSGKLDEARHEYQQALTEARGEARAQALRGLVNTAIASKQYGEAESDVREYLATAPQDAQAHLLLGRLLAAQGKNDEALAELSSAGSQDDPRVLRDKAALLSAAHRETDALPIYKRLVELDGNNAQLHYEYAVALMHGQHWAEAQNQLLNAIKLNPNLGSAYGDLAIVASDNQQYELTLKALDVRTKLLGDNPGTYFLRATALDHLRRYPEATQNYRQFLSAANGKYPDEEWKARHRLLAIEKLK